MANPISKAIVPAAGLGTRLLPATKSQPKEMLPVARKPIVQYVVEELQSANLSQILLVTGRRKNAIEDHFDPDPYLLSLLTQAGNETLLAELSYIQRQTRFFYTRQSQAQGLGHAVSLGARFVDDESCVVALGDSLIAGNDPAGPVRAMIQAHQDLKAAAVIAVEQVESEETHHYGIIHPQGSLPGAKEPFRVNDIVEKPAQGTAPSNLAVAARYVFSPSIFEALERTPPDQKGEIQLTDAIRLLIHSGQPVYAWLLGPDQPRYDIGNFESYFRTFIDMVLTDERYGYMARQYIKAKAYEL
ncbi:MAG TPA: UTP--glucose-1-phosphate uridylyltransferase [Terriglobia bacterium]|nr:UTP--glucose-1-phosphate uridylyltransferase [Terriglobia bacterium]